MQKEFYDHKIQREDMNNKVNALRALLFERKRRSGRTATGSGYLTMPVMTEIWISWRGHWQKESMSMPL